MSQETTGTAEVVVHLDPARAFAVFTEEMESWWTPGPINFWDSARAIGIRCEGCVGGRIVEVYDAMSGDGLELGRITVWEPGERVVWQSSVDDVVTTVRFLPEGAGTRVVVEAVVPEGGRDEGGSAFVRVAPARFGAWARRRDGASPETLSRLAVLIRYADPARAARWITEVLGLEPLMPIPEDPGSKPWIEFRAGSGILVVFGPGPDAPAAASHEPFLFVDDVDAHHLRAKEMGATIIQDVEKYGYTAYRLEDPEGHRWTVAAALHAMA
jgi:uncharacterized glyoxalase superfamily protein PhnB